jgi:LuxR family maltose regulon positive regulatory protein
VLLARADELEAVLRLSLGDLRSAAELASELPATRRSLLLARVALAAGDHHAATEHLDISSLEDLTPRTALVRQVLLAAAAIQRGDPEAAGIVGGVLQTARHDGFLNTVVTTVPEVTRYLVEHSTYALPDPFLERITGAALQVRATQPGRSGRILIAPLTDAELRVLKLLPTTSYVQIDAALYISLNTVKTHLRSIYQKLGASSRPEAIQRAVELRML